MLPVIRFFCGCSWRFIFTHTQVQYASSPGSRSSCAISVQMPEGDVVRVDEVDASGATIDAEYRELEN